MKMIIRIKKRVSAKNATTKTTISKKEQVKEDITDYLKQKGLTKKDIDNILYHRETTETKSISIKQGKHKFKVGIVSDTHLGSKTCALEELHNIYKRFKKEGVEIILHPGDICDGDGRIYKGHFNELLVYGYDDMTQYLIENYPKEKGITTYFIGGNHDESFIQSNGSNICKALASQRDDMIYLGMYDSEVEIEGVKFGLHHGDGGGAYAYSYKLQKFVETLTGDRKPQVYLLGHYHTAVYSVIRNMHCMTCASFQKPNNFSTRKGLPNIVGGYILHIETSKDGSITSFLPEFIPYYF